MLVLQQAISDHDIGRWLLQLGSDFWQQLSSKFKELNVFQNTILRKLLRYDTVQNINKVSQQTDLQCNWCYSYHNTNLEFLSPHFFSYCFFTRVKACFTILILNYNWLHQRKPNKGKVTVYLLILHFFLLGCHVLILVLKVESNEKCLWKALKKNKTTLLKRWSFIYSQFLKWKDKLIQW